MWLSIAAAVMYAVGAHMTWEEVSRYPRGPSPDGAFYSKKLQDHYDSHPELHNAEEIATVTTCVVLWPLVMGLGIIHFYLKALRKKPTSRDG